MAVKHASAPKAYINITGLGFAKLTKEGAELKYSDITKTKGLQKIGVETGGELKTAYADGGPIESGNTDGEGKISLQMHAFPKEIRKIVFNEDYDEDGVYEEKQGKQNNYVAVWFRQERRDVETVHLEQFYYLKLCLQILKSMEKRLRKIGISQVKRLKVRHFSL